MRCEVCEEKAVFSQPARCKEHFCLLVEETVKETIESHRLCSKDDRICVGASGGKDSAALLVILQKLGYHVEALAVDEGIAGYRDRSLEDLRRLCSSHDIPLQIVSFAEMVGRPLDEMVEGRHPCSVCGVFRRYLLNKYAQGFDLVATGHNLDDEAQAVLMNLMKASKGLLERTYLRTPVAEGFVPRIKPLFFLSEKMIMAYVLLQGLEPYFVECPHVYQSLRSQVRDELNAYELDHPGMKRSLVDAALARARNGAAHVFTSCPRCGEPSTSGVCHACLLKDEVLSS